MKIRQTRIAPSPSPLSKILTIFIPSGLIRRQPRPAAQPGLQNPSNPGTFECGGYNEAFVIQYWAGYNPRH